MKRPTLWKVSVTTAPEAEEAVAEVMNQLWAQSPSIYHDAETGQSMVQCISRTSLPQRPLHIPTCRVPCKEYVSAA